MDYHARFYHPTRGRFTQPDTIIPSPANPQSLNRYTYVINNPIRYVDPSGNSEEEAYCEENLQASGCYTQDELEDMLALYGVTVQGWGAKEMWYIFQAVAAVGARLAEVFGGTGVDAFRSVYETVKFVLCAGTSCPHADDYVTNGMVTMGKHKIGIADFRDTEVGAVNNVIHELGHAFNNILGDDPASKLDAWYNDGNTDLKRIAGKRGVENYGYYSVQKQDWSLAMQDTFGTSSEEFADSFVAWVTDMYDQDSSGNLTTNGSRRRNYMESYMQTGMPIDLCEVTGCFDNYP